MKEFFKKIVSLVLLFTLAVSVLASCSNAGDDTTVTDPSGTPPDQQTTPGDSTTAEPAPIETLAIVTNGQSQFSLIIPAGASDKLIDLIKTFKEKFEKKTGVALPVKNEGSNSVTNNDFEILIGKTSRADAASVYEGLRAKDFLYCIKKNKLIITGGSDESTETAVNYFNRKFIDAAVKNDKSNIVFTSEDNHFDNSSYSLPVISVAGTPLHKFCIVYSTNDPYSAELFALKTKQKILSDCGYNVEVYSDNRAPANAKMIVVGNTKYSSNTATVSGYDYGIHVENGNVYAYSASIEGYDSLLKDIFGKLFSGKEPIDVPNGAKYNNTSDLDIVNIKKAIDGDVRVILSNILGNCNNTTHPVSYRTKSVTELLSSYSPDVLGLQECSPRSRDAGVVTLLKKYGYTEAPANPTNSSKNNYTPLFYNAKTVKLLAYDYVYYPGSFNDSGSKSITWGVFEHLETKEKFAVCSTHFFYQSEATAGRVENAKMLSDTVKMLATKYNVPVIAGGDLNTRVNSDPFSTLLDNGLSMIQKLAKETDNTKTSHSYPELNKDLGYYAGITPPKEDAYLTEAIDHVLVYNGGNLEFNRFCVIDEEFALMSSDHCPLLVDFKFK